MKRLRLALAALPLLLLPGELFASNLLVIDVRTDYEFGAEFSFVEVLMIDRSDERRSWHAIGFSSGRDFLTGVRVAEFDDVDRGTYLISVTLLDGRRRPVDGRFVLLDMGRSATAVTALVPRR